MPIVWNTYYTRVTKHMSYGCPNLRWLPYPKCKIYEHLQTWATAEVQPQVSDGASRSPTVGKDTALAAGGPTYEFAAPA